MREMILVFVGLVFDLPVIAREFERELVGLGTGGGEVNRRRVRVAVANDLFGELHRGLVGGPDIGRGKGDAAHLRRRGVGELAAAVADIDIPQPR